jgi:hypothetical protein
MASSVSALNSLLLNPYAQQAVQDVQFKGGLNPLKPGAAVTAHYSVGDDGELVLRDFNVDNAKVLAPADEKRRQPAKRDTGGDAERTPSRQASFSDIARPKATLAPSDEVEVFAASNNNGALRAIAADNNEHVSEAQYEEIGKAPTPEVKTVAAQRQEKVANLYARNLDIIYNIVPVYSAAA